MAGYPDLLRIEAGPDPAKSLGDLQLRPILGATKGRGAIAGLEIASAGAVARTAIAPKVITDYDGLNMASISEGAVSFNELSVRILDDIVLLFACEIL